MDIYRKIFEIEGIVQGVGFRPAIYSIAEVAGVGGWIKNCSGKVLLAVEGEECEIDSFIASLYSLLPLQARIDKIYFSGCEYITAVSKFRILDSDIDSSFKVSIPIDLAMCSECEKEITTPSDRRYKYPFTTCVNCGPRYTVVNSMPYDRCRTTLSSFPLCPECEKEYIDPKNRRFHAESTACSVCGPKLFLSDSGGKQIECDDPLNSAAEKILEGRIVAIRGIGGFLLAVDALDTDAIECLRDRKKRPHKPLAVMAKNMEVVKEYCKVSNQEVAMLMSSSAPIVILDIKESIGRLPLDLLSPDSDTLGVMLPYSPMHRLLFHETNLKLIVMTSGNQSGEPLCIKNEEVFKRLYHIADYILWHNREINLRNDDSLCTMQRGNMQVWRRARGYAPEAVKVDCVFNETVLAMGSELKNCIAMAHDREVVISPHIGDLETSEAVDSLKSIIKYFPNFLRLQPNIIAVDLHPDMHSTRLGYEYAQKMNIPIVMVQHHHAHAASCMAEHGLKKALALVFDGTGLGLDGNIWGAEALYINNGDFSRFATFAPVPLPGGDAAVYNPIRQLVARFHMAGIVMTEEMLENYKVSEEEYRIWCLQCDKGINAPLTHAAGRLFDSFAALLGICSSVTYEGQGAIRLETKAKSAIKKRVETVSLPFSFYEKNEMLYINWDKLFLFLHDEFKKIRYNQHLLEQLALSFHKTVAIAAGKMIEYSLSKTSIDNIVLSGGVFMNKILTDFVVDDLESKGLKVFLHNKVPPNDGGISLGQAMVCNEQLISLR